MSEKRRKVTATVLEGQVYAAIVAGSSQADAARQFGVSRQHVSRIVKTFAVEVDARAEALKAEAVDSSARARLRLREVSLDLVEKLIVLCDSEDEAIAKAAIVAALDRGGVPAKTDIGHELSVTPEKVERVLAMAKLLAS